MQRALTIGALLLAGCYLGAGPSVGVSVKRHDVVLGWEATATTVAGVTGGQTFRRGEITSWGAFAIELPVVHDRDARAVSLWRAQLGGAEGATNGLVWGLGAGAMARPSMICNDGDWVVDLTLSIRRIAGDTQVVMTGRGGFYPYTPGCVVDP